MAHEIISNSGDTLDEDEIRSLLGRSAISGYIAEGGVSVTYHDSDDTIDVSPGKVHVLDNLHDITVETDSWVGYGLEANAVNNVWIAVDGSEATDDEAVGLVHNTTGVAPSAPSIKIAKVDTNQSGDAAVTPANRGTAAALEGESVDVGGLSVRGEAVQTALGGYVVPVATDVGVSDAIDPDSATTPIQDAIDTVAAASRPYGGVLLPPSIIEEQEHIDAERLVSIYGWGRPSEIRFTDPADCGILLDDAHTCKFESFRLRVPGATQPTQPALRTENGGFHDCRFRHLWIAGFIGDGCVIDFVAGHPYGSDFGHFRIDGCDANGGALIKYTASGGAPLRWGTFNAYADDSYSGQDSDFMHFDAHSCTIQQLNLGGTLNRAIYAAGNCDIGLGFINWEPTDKNSVTGGVFDLGGGTQFAAQTVRFVNSDNISRAGAATRYCYLIRPGVGRCRLPPPNGAAPERDAVSVRGDDNGNGPSDLVLYEGRADNVEIRGGVSWGHGRRVRTLWPDDEAGLKATLTNNFSVPSNTQKDVPLDDNVYSGSDTLDVSAQTIVPHRPGVYAVTGQLVYASLSEGTTYQAILNNGRGQPYAASHFASGSSTEQSAPIATTLRIERGDGVRLQTRQNSGSAKDVASGRAQTQLSVRRIG